MGNKNALLSLYFDNQCQHSALYRRDQRSQEENRKPQVKLVDGFTKKFHVDKLVYYEVFDDIKSAITRERQIKSGSRQKKIDLIRRMNRKWLDLASQL